MSTLSKLLREVWDDLLSLLLPAHCPVCGALLEEGEQTICTLCRATAPLTGYCREADNAVVRKFWGIVPVANASCFLYFVHGSGWREVIHDFKYKGYWRLAYIMGRWYGEELRTSGLYDDIDVVVPLPLHPLKQMKRGYNQSDYLADGIARSLGVEVERRAVRRCRNTRSQALRQRHEREKNVAKAFRVARPRRLEGRHILLVDDVLTTGSTLSSCAAAILEAVPSCRISIAALAAPRHELGLKE